MSDVERVAEAIRRADLEHVGRFKASWETLARAAIAALPPRTADFRLIATDDLRAELEARDADIAAMLDNNGEGAK